MPIKVTQFLQNENLDISNREMVWLKNTWNILKGTCDYQGSLKKKLRFTKRHSKCMSSYKESGSGNESEGYS